MKKHSVFKGLGAILTFAASCSTAFGQNLLFKDDKDAANAALFTRAVIDTPQADPVLPNRSVRGALGTEDIVGEAWRLISGSGYIEVTLDRANPESAPEGAAQVTYDNVELWLYEQTTAQLDLDLCAGLTITGTVGTVYSVEYVTDLAQTNSPGAWRCLEYLQLPASPYLWIDKSAPVTGKRFYRALAMEAPTNMVFIPPGTFRMGSPTNEVDRSESEGPQTDVIISRGFWMGKFEVTQGEYLALMGNNPSWFNGVRDWPEPTADFGADLSRPVESVSWNDAVAYCAALTERGRSAGSIAPNAVYRLPTEAEWEYACRAWTSTRFSYGDDPGYTNLANYAWYRDNSGGTTHPVGRKLSNPWGLYDMHGNVWEWCQDWYADYPGGLVLDPQGPGSGSTRVFRGGCWCEIGWPCAWSSRSAFRYTSPPENKSHHLGFRAVLAPGRP